MNSTKDRLVIYFGGRMMKGVFGAGVAAAFLNNNIYQKIKAIYASSAGVMTGAYFLSNQPQLGSSIYWEDLTRNFISQKDFFIGVWQRFQNRFIKSIPWENFHDAINIDYLMQIVKNKKPLNFEQITQQKIPLYVKLFNLETHSIKYIDARGSDILKILKAGINLFPYTHDLSEIDGKKYIDAGIIESIGIDFIRRANPKDMIFIVLNRQPFYKLRYKIKNKIEGKFMKWMFNDARLSDLYSSAEENFKKDLQLIQQDSRIVLITPPKNIPIQSKTTNSFLLRQAYDLGFKVGQEVIQNYL